MSWGKKRSEESLIECLRQPLYTRFALLPEYNGREQELEAFAEPRGVMSSTLKRLLTGRDTNLDQAGSLIGRRMAVEAIVLNITARSRADYLCVYENLYMVFRIVDRDYLWITLQHIAPAYVSVLRNEVISKMKPRLLASGDFHLDPRCRRFVYRLASPLTLGPYECFNMRVRCELNLRYPVEVYLALDGKQMRPS